MDTRTLDVYRAGIDAYLAQWGLRRYRVPPLLRELISTLPRGAWVLDLGCGPAQDARYLAQKGYRSVGLDAVQEFLAWARSVSAATPLIRADMRHLPFGARAFDAVWAAASLIHLPKRDVRVALAALHTIVAPGGRLAATFVHGTASGVLARGWLPGRYVSRWTNAELARALERSGWNINSLKTVTNLERKGRWLNLTARSSG
ncbi:MAG TPA: class I SAM-dependent methyltransferase [Nitrospiria bacterium]|nr:class I SAM-dependent methyltransferase [Nitrospiria bacterium]